MQQLSYVYSVLKKFLWDRWYVFTYRICVLFVSLVGKLVNNVVVTQEAMRFGLLIKRHKLGV
jgi:hypothetical protein